MKYEPLKLSLENWRKFAISRIALAKEELEKAGYYDDWDNIDDLAKNKMEAFNLGRHVAAEGLMTVLLKMVDETEDEIKQHVKSAVQGLLEEIEEKSFTYQYGENRWERHLVITLEDVRGLIKKWFADVVEGEKR